MSDIELFLQGEGIRDVKLVRLPSNATVRDIADAAKSAGALGDDGGVIVTIEDADEELVPEVSLSTAGVRHRGRVHVHRCRRVVATVNYNGQAKALDFAPSATIERLHRRATGRQGFGLADADAAEHLLQLCGSAERPDVETHVGTLVTAPACTVCFDLVPKQRVEG